MMVLISHKCSGGRNSGFAQPSVLMSAIFGAHEGESVQLCTLLASY